MGTRKTILVSLCLIAGLTQIPAANAQVAQIVVAGLRVLPVLLKPLTRKAKQQSSYSDQSYGQQQSGNHKHGNRQQQNNDSGQENDQQQTAQSNAPDSGGTKASVIQTVHGSLVAQKVPASGQQTGGSSTTGNHQDQAGTSAPYVMMTSP